MKPQNQLEPDIFIYAKLEHEQNKIKTQNARQLLESLKGQIIISTQVLNEFSNVLIRYKIDDEKIQDTVETIIEECVICPVELKTVEKAWHIRIRYQFSYWDLPETIRTIISVRGKPCWSGPLLTAEKVFM